MRVIRPSWHCATTQAQSDVRRAVVRHDVHRVLHDEAVANVSMVRSS